ncbi:MAG: hypothetical protein M3445_10205 [Actinomycetota bacterium]|nr:hypothetical protein [Actinomycetota bacterium]
MTRMMEYPLLAIGLFVALIALVLGLFVVFRVYSGREVRSDHAGSQTSVRGDTGVEGEAQREKGADGL